MDTPDLSAELQNKPVEENTLPATPATEQESATAPETPETKVEQPQPAEEPKAEEVPAEEPKAEDAPAEEPKAEEAPAEEPKAEDAPAEEPKAEEPEKESTLPASKEEVVERLAHIAELPAADISREGVSRLKQIFYTFHNAEVEAQREEFVAAGNDPEAFTPAPSEIEEKLKDLLNIVKEKKAAAAAAMEEERKANLEKKNTIIASLVEMAADTDNVNRTFPRFKELQQDFKLIGEVPPTDASDVWKRYQDAVERYYDQLKINKDLRDYDFRKNLDTKQLLCEQAEALVDEGDVITAFKRLQDLHDKWRETGPVAKEQREEIWNRFKDASAAINKKYQAFFEERKARERENELAKTAICERVEALDFSELRTYAQWEAMTAKIMEAQADWKKLGFASKKMNNSLFARFRETCDKFFAAKAEHFRSMKDELQANLAKKIALCEKAEALQDSTDWKATGEALAELQKEWKQIGTVPKKHSDNVWKRFQTACNHFFDARKEKTSGARAVEQANLKAKREIIDALKAIDTAEMDRDEAIAKVRELSSKWQGIGHVPFREKDKVYDAYREIVNALYKALDMRVRGEQMARFETSLAEMDGDEIKMLRERERMIRAYEQRKSELNTYENNLMFFNSKSKTGDSLVREMQKKIERLKDDIKVLEEKIKVIDTKL